MQHSWVRNQLVSGALLGALAIFGLGCSTLPEMSTFFIWNKPEPPPEPVVVVEPVEDLRGEYEERHALDRDRIGSLEMEIERLRDDLARAEATMLATDSEVRAARNRATAVSVLAEARISVEKAEVLSTWRPDELEEARSKLAEAEKQLTGGHPPAAVYFASRGQRIAQSLIAEAERVEGSSDARFVRVGKLNLRTGPSTGDRVIRTLKRGEPVFEQRQRGQWARVRTLRGELGWVHGSMLRR